MENISASACQPQTTLFLAGGVWSGSRVVYGFQTVHMYVTGKLETLWLLTTILIFSTKAGFEDKNCGGTSITCPLFYIRLFIFNAINKYSLEPKGQQYTSELIHYIYYSHRKQTIDLWKISSGSSRRRKEKPDPIFI